MITKADPTEVAEFLSQYPDVTECDALIFDLCGRAIGKRYPRADMEKLFSDGSYLCAATYLLDARGATSDPLGYGISDGDPDAAAWPLAGRLSPVTWIGAAGTAEGSVTRAQCVMRLEDRGTAGNAGHAIWFEPQAVLERVLARFAELKLRPVVAVELEFYLVDAQPGPNGGPQPPCVPRSGRRLDAADVYGLSVLDDFSAVLSEMTRACSAAKLPVTTALSEYGVGQFELNLRHTTDVLSAAHDAAMMRRIVTEVARAHGFDATFMAKPYANDAGSGLQIHLSVLDEAGRNVFAPNPAEESTALGAAVAGMQATMGEALALMAPNFNSYRRFAPDQFTPVTRDWGIDNRSMAFRIPPSTADNTRIEHRVAGADANPFLVLAAVLAGAHYGITNRLEPTPIATGNVGSPPDPTLPRDLATALEALASAEILPEYLDPKYLEAYGIVKRAELAAFQAEVFRREWDWYL